jgi:LysR family glycine cleavage system transcriptional activator
MANLSRQLPPLSTLAAFEAAFRHRNFTRAAAELRLTQASISRLIRQLEQDLGVRLFDRGRRDVTPTAAGAAYAETVRRALGELAAESERLRATGRGERSLTVFAELGLASSLIAPMIGTFQRRHPGVSIRIVTSPEPVQAFDRDCDVGLRSGWWAEQAYTVIPVADDAIYPVCAPDFLARLDRPVTPERVAQGPLLHWEEARDAWPDWPGFLASFGLTIPAGPPGPTITAYEVLLDFAEKTDGFALAWARSAQDRIAAGRLARVPGMTLAMPDHTAAHIPKRAPKNPLVEEFVALLKETAPALAG